MRPNIYLFGDSITEQSFSAGGWGASLANHFSRNIDVSIRGYSGYNTRWALMAIDKVFPPPPPPPAPPAAENGGSGGDGHEAAPLCVTVFFGANDASLPNRHAAFQHVPMDEYKQNLHSIVSFFKKRWPSTHVILITPPPIDEANRILNSTVKNKEGLPERTNESAGNYAKACLSVASECRIPAIDLWTKMQQSAGWRNDFLCDGLHLTPGGNRVVFEELIGKLKQLGVSSQTLPMELPDFIDIDPNDPINSLSN